MTKKTTYNLEREKAGAPAITDLQRVGVDQAGLQRLDALADRYSGQSLAQLPRFSRAVTTAVAMQELRDALMPYMPHIMGLMNQPLGFLTDKDPSKAKPGENIVPYSQEVICSVVVEATLRGFLPVGNEFNVISGRFYGAKAGVTRRVQQWPGMEWVRVVPGVPINKDRGALVPVDAEWQMAGVKQELSRTFPVKVNQYMGSDAVIGKATRKMYAAILELLTGMGLPEGEVGDDVGEVIEVQPGKPTTGRLSMGDLKAADEARAKATPFDPKVVDTAGMTPAAPVDYTAPASAIGGVSPLVKAALNGLDRKMLHKCARETGEKLPTRWAKDALVAELAKRPAVTQWLALYAKGTTSTEDAPGKEPADDDHEGVAAVQRIGGMQQHAHALEVDWQEVTDYVQTTFECLIGQLPEVHFMNVRAFIDRRARAETID